MWQRKWEAGWLGCTHRAEYSIHTSSVKQCYFVNTWWVTKECNLTSALSRTSFHTSSPYDSLMKSWRLSHSSPYMMSLWIERKLPNWSTSNSPRKCTCKRVRRVHCCELNIPAFSSHQKTYCIVILQFKNNFILPSTLPVRIFSD